MRYILLSFVFIFIVGCSEKEIFIPSKIEKKNLHETYTSYKLYDYNDNYLTFSKLKKRDDLCNSEVVEYFVDDNGKKIRKNFIKIDKDLAANGDKLLVLSTNRVYTLPFIIFSAKKEGNLVAVVFDDNSYGVFDLNDSSMKFYNSSEKVLSVRYIKSSPIFYKDLVLFPLLNGNVAVVDIKNYQFIRSLTISSDDFNNNVIFLKLFNNKLYMATSSKFLMFNSKFIIDYKANIKHILFFNGYFYIFKKNGEVVKLNEDLKEVAKKSLKYADFVSPFVCNGNVYVIEKGDYLIKFDDNLNYKVFSGKYSEFDFDKIIKAKNCKIYNSKRVFKVE